MTATRGFCPRCGTAVDPDEAYSLPGSRAAGDATICADCLLEDLDLVSVPETITIGICGRCGAVRTDEDWEDVEAADYTEVAIDTVADRLQIHRDATDVSWSVTPVQRGPNELDIQCHVNGTIADTHLSAEPTVTVRISTETCGRCGRIAGDYYAATVQVRAIDRSPTSVETDRATDIAESVVDSNRATGDRDAFITEVIERSEGVDIRVSTSSIGSSIAQRVVTELGGTVDSSERLITEDGDGNRVYRVAFAVRLPRFKPGDVIEPADDAGPIAVEAVGETVRGRRLATGNDVKLEDAAIDTATLVGHVDDATDTTFVTVEDEHAIQVLHPDSYEVQSIPRPDGFEPTDTVSVIDVGGALYVLPEASDVEAE